ncbi:MAG: hypothetical protein HY601_02090, partial [Candidatus Omnitrophica bacterium]|nr:hypothetical protein [Candidatus Omnitrophota bacterium]
GYEAIGHLAEPEEIVKVVKQLLPVIGAPASPARPSASRPAARKKAKKR